MSSTERSGSPFYDPVWESFGALDAVSPASFHRRRQLLSLIREFGRGPRNLLELGCGQGALLKRLELELPSVTLVGADVSAVALATTREACPDAELVLLDLQDPAFAERHRAQLGRFDLVLCSEVLEHLDDDALALRHVRALLAPGGRVIVSVPGDTPTRFDRAIGHRRHYTVRTLTELLESADFEVDRVFAWGLPFHSAYRQLVRLAARFTFSENAQPTPLPPLLSAGYRGLSRVLRLLYFLNLSHAGPQLFAVAQRREPPG